mgnify:CR=1 FL=1
MGLNRLDDAEFARRVRERNNRVNAAHRARLVQSGKSQTNVWLPAQLRMRLDEAATADGVSLSVVVERLLSAALIATGPTAPIASVSTMGDPDTAPLFEPDSTDFNPVESDSV